MNLTKLYAKAKNGAIKEWSISVQEDTITVLHGKMDGKMQAKLTVCTGKNIGRANETTPNQQAQAEMISKINKQYDRCYRYSVKEALSVGNLLPMLAANYLDKSHLIKYPCDVSRKLDGLRCICKVNLADGAKWGDIKFASRGGKTYPVPEHLRTQLYRLAVETGIDTFDGELYIHGKSLQKITSCAKKPNEMTPDLQFHIFDSMNAEDEEWFDRKVRLEILEDVIGMSPKTFFHIRVVENIEVANEAEARTWMELFMREGYEGLMLRNLDGFYLYNHRSSDLQKWKDFQDCEAKVLEVEEDKLGEGVLVVCLPDKTEFRCKMKGTHESRLVTEQRKLIGRWITVKYQTLTDDGVCQFPVGMRLRDCDEEGNPLD